MENQQCKVAPIRYVGVQKGQTVWKEESPRRTFVLFWWAAFLPRLHSMPTFASKIYEKGILNYANNYPKRSSVPQTKILYKELESLKANSNYQPRNYFGGSTSN